MDWDDLRYILAVHDCGSAWAAAQKLDVNASTVQRRIIKFEKENNVHLFERLRGGYRPTADCLSLVQSSREMENRAAYIHRNILGKDLRLEGNLTIISTDAVFVSVIAPHLAEFHKANPLITADIRLTSTRVNLMRQQADIAIRPSFEPTENLVGKCVADLQFGIYGSSELVSSIPEDSTLDDLRKKAWLAPGNAFSGSTSQKWMRHNLPLEACSISVDSFWGIAACAAESMGLAILPCIIADPNPKLQRLHVPWFNLSSPLWVLTHREIKNAARIRVFMDHITKALQNERAFLEGRVEEPQ